MKKYLFFLAGFLLVFVCTVSAAASQQVGKTAVSVHLDLGKNNGDSIAQLGGGLEYNIIPHISGGIGYVYVDGQYPLQSHGIDFYVKGFLFDKPAALYGFNILARVGLQLYYQDEPGMTGTLFTGLEWQSPFGLFLSLEGGAELESGDFGYLYGAVLGFRF